MEWFEIIKGDVIEFGNGDYESRRTYAKLTGYDYLAFNGSTYDTYSINDIEK